VVYADAKLAAFRGALGHRAITGDDVALGFTFSGHAQSEAWGLGLRFQSRVKLEPSGTIKYDNDPDRYLEAGFRRAEIAYNHIDKKTAQKELEFVVKTGERYSAANIETDNYFIAQAQFLLAELQFESFKEIELKPPLKQNLKLKRVHFESVIKAYTETARYKVAEWSTAASYRLGETFEAFADALLTAPVPRQMSDDELLAYNTKLRASILPFKEKALRAYETNLKQAEKHNIDNYWIVESKRRIGILSSELDIESSELTEKRGI
jgi:hypothetical protein